MFLDIGLDAVREKAVMNSATQGNQRRGSWVLDRSFMNVSLLFLAAALQPICGKSVVGCL